MGQSDIVRTASQTCLNQCFATICLQALALPTDCCLNGTPSLRISSGDLQIKKFTKNLVSSNSQSGFCAWISGIDLSLEQKSGFPSLLGTVPCPWWARRHTGWAGEAGRIAAFAARNHWDPFSQDQPLGFFCCFTEDLQRFFLFNHATVKVSNTYSCTFDMSLFLQSKFQKSRRQSISDACKSLNLRRVPQYRSTLPGRLPPCRCTRRAGGGRIAVHKILNLKESCNKRKGEIGLLQFAGKWQSWTHFGSLWLLSRSPNQSLADACSSLLTL